MNPKARKWNGKSTYRLDNALREAAEASRAIAIAQQSLRATIEAAELEAANQVAILLETEVPPSHLHLGGWECAESPTGRCIYNRIEDPHRDDCLICHDPAERK